MASQPPFFELRIGGLHLTVQRFPYRFLTVVTALSSAAGTGMLFSR